MTRRRTKKANAPTALDCGTFIPAGLMEVETIARAVKRSLPEGHRLQLTLIKWQDGRELLAGFEVVDARVGGATCV